MRAVPRLVVVLLAAVVVAAMVTVSAQESKWVRGSVTAMSGNTVTVKVGGTDMSFTVDKATRVIGPGGSTATREAIQKGKEGPTLAELLKVGDGVEVHYAQTGTTNYARIIRRGVTGTGVSAPAAAKSEAEPGKSVTGQVQAVTGNSLTVNADGRDYVFVVEPGARVLGTGFGTKAREKAAGGEKPAITDFVAKNDLVLVDYKQVGTELRAVEIHMVQKLLK